MEYVVFTIVLAAGGVIIFWAWNRFEAVNKTNRVTRSQPAKADVLAGPIPPFKRTISGPRVEDLEHAEFENRIGSWQKKLYEIASDSPAPENGLSGTKYTYVPKPRRSAMQTDNGI